MEIDKISHRAESFFNEISEEYYLSAAGLKEESNLSAIYEKYEDLSSKELITELVESSSEDGSSREQFQLLEFIYSLYQGFSTRKLTDTLLQLEATSTFDFEGKDTPYRQAPLLIKNESDRKKRKSIQRAVHKIVDRDNPMRIEALELVHSAASEFGFDTYTDLISHISGLDLDGFVVDCETFLADTESMYTDVAQWAFKKHMGLDLNDTKTYDSPYLFRMSGYDDYFPAGELLGRVDKFISSMGLSMNGEGNIKIDTDDRPLKTPRAFCAPISVPDNIVLVIMPQGGLSDYQSFLHELGHSMHYAHVDATLPMENRYLGDNSVTESFAMLFDHLTLNKQWLKKVARMDNPKDYLIMANLLELYMLRRYCAKFIYEKELHGNSVLEDMPDAYSSILTEATKIQYEPVNYLNDVDSEFYCARYLRAWMLQSSLNAYMTEEGGDDWFRNPSSGERLRNLWKYGQKMNAEEIVKLVSTDKLSFKDLTRSIENAFNG